jgi:hypothetical protein
MNSAQTALQPAVKPVNGPKLWADEAASAGLVAATSVAQLGNDEFLALLFTADVVRTRSHFLNTPTMRGYVRCTGGDCLLCQLNRQCEVRDLLPVYSPVERAVVVLPISPNMRPAALRPQLVPLLQQLQRDGGRPPLVGIRRIDVGRYTVSSLPLPADADDGAPVIKAFRTGMDSGEIDLAATYSAPIRQELAMLPDIVAAMRARGLKP